VRGTRRGISTACIYTILWTRNDGRARLDSVGIGGVRILDAGPSGYRRLFVLSGEHSAATGPERGC